MYVAMLLRFNDTENGNIHFNGWGAMHCRLGIWGCFNFTGKKKQEHKTNDGGHPTTRAILLEDGFSLSNQRRQFAMVRTPHTRRWSSALFVDHDPV